MFTVNYGVSVPVLRKFGDSFSSPMDTPSGSMSSNWPYPEGHDTGFKTSKTPPVPIISTQLPDIGTIMEKVQRHSARVRDAATIGCMGVARTMNTARKAIRF